MERPETDSASEASYWENDGFPEPQEQVLPPDNTELINPPEKTCPVCGEEIVREPGRKGRLPKYHPDCKPSAKGSTGGARPVRVTAKDRAVAEEVEATLAQVESKFRDAIMMLAVVEPYDAFVLYVNMPKVLDNLRPILSRYPMLRQQAGTASTAAAIFGLVTTVLTILLPIAAHHGLIPSKKIAKILAAVPVFMKRLNDVMDSGVDIGEMLMSRVQEQQAKNNEARRRAQAHSESVDASFTG
jgi:hypothetical protein